ncbi:hypothetical protein PM082_000748 [Marasmius tenuissimus]|nr:hypothetical protein PM082_000748 [Marasmius tenuissimus]
MRYVGQCEELQIEVSWEILAAVVDPGEVSFPVLRSLKAIRQPEDDQIERLGWFREALARAPLLRDLRLERLETAPRFFPLSRITALALDDSHGFDCVSPGLAACTSLERFERFIFSESAADVHRTVRLEIVWAYQPRTKISNLLSVLTLCTESNNDDLMVPQLSKFVLHSECKDLVWGYPNRDVVVNSLVEMLS